jgi:hypothetical protein
MRLVSGRSPAGRAAGRVVLAVTSVAMAAGIMVSTAGSVSASVTRPSVSAAKIVPHYVRRPGQCNDKEICY